MLTALAVSMTEPPPRATRLSQPSSRQRVAMRSTTAVEESAGIWSQMAATGRPPSASTLASRVASPLPPTPLSVSSSGRRAPSAISSSGSCSSACSPAINLTGQKKS
ncbi:hypothetical protein D3C78_491210 [compost metagenome]